MISKKIRKEFWIFGVLFLGFFISLASGATDWSVVKDDEVTFNISVLDKDVKTVAGTFTLTFDDINSSGAIFYSLSNDLTVSTSKFENNLTGSNLEATGNNISILTDLLLLYSNGEFLKFKELVKNESTALDYINNPEYSRDDVEFRFKTLSYGWEIKFEDTKTNINTFIKIQYDRYGLLQHYQHAVLDVNGKETTIKITQASFTGARSSIPGFSSVLVFSFSITTMIGILITRKRGDK